jgi:isopenicillin N synthase-like dioxygenase
MAVPTLDFAKYLHGSQEEKFELGVALVQGFKDFGFVKLVNHGLPEETVKDFLDLVRYIISGDL